MERPLPLSHVSPAARTVARILLMIALVLSAANASAEKEAPPAIDSESALALLARLGPELAGYRRDLEYGTALRKLQEVAVTCADPAVQFEVARLAAPLSREQVLLLRLVEAGEAGCVFDFAEQARVLRPAGLEGYRLAGSQKVRPWRALHPRAYLALFGQIEIDPSRQLDLAEFCLFRGLEGEAALAIRSAREGDPELKSRADRLLAGHRGEQVPRGGYELYLGRWVPLDKRDLGRELLSLATMLDAGDLTEAEQRLVRRLRSAAERLASENIPHLLEALVARLERDLRADESRARSLLASHGTGALCRRRLDIDEELGAKRKEALALIGTYEKPQQPEVDAFRYALADLFEKAERLREHDERRLHALSPGEAWVLLERLLVRERAASRIWAYLAEHAPGLFLPPPLRAVEPALATLHILPGRRRSGLEEVFWLILNARAGRRVYVIERIGELAPSLPDLELWERMVIRDVRVRNLRAYNRHAATSLSIRERECITATNDYRVTLGLRPFEIDERVVQAARAHSQEMVDMGYFGHTSPVEKNRTPSDRVRNAGYLGGASENCYIGGVSGVSAFEAWYHSPGHHRNMVAEMPHMGVGHDRGGSHWTMNPAAVDISWRLMHEDLAPVVRAEMEREIDWAATRRTPEARAPLLTRGVAALPAVARRALSPSTNRHERLGHLELLVELAEQERNQPLLRAAVDALIPVLLSDRPGYRVSAAALLRRLLPWELDYAPDGSADQRARDVARLRDRIEREREEIGAKIAGGPAAGPPARPRTTSRPPSIKSRLQPLTRRDRLRLAMKHGGSPETEQAVERGLAWLAAHQRPDGSFRARAFTSACRLEPHCSGEGTQEYEVGLTGLTLLAFLAAGNTPEMGEHAAVVEAGVEFLMRNLQDFGKFATTSGQYMYSHALGTQALLEAYAYTADPDIGRAARLALDYLIYAQHGPSGGWRYRAKQEGDTSVTGWVILALHSARKAGFDAVGLAGARRFLDRVSEPGYYHVGYQRINDRRGPGNRLSAVGMVIRQVLGTRRAAACLRLPAERIAGDPPVKTRPDPYYWYYGTLALFQMGGDEWRRWNRALVPAVTGTQDLDRRACTHGSWAPRGEYTAEGGRLYTTALHVLMLTVYYRYDIFPEVRPDVLTGSIESRVRPHLDRFGDVEDPVGREVAKRIVEEKFGSGAATLLIAELGKQNSDERQADLAEVLANVASDEYVPAILDLMETVRGNALSHLGRGLVATATHRNLGALVAFLRHEHATVRLHAVRALARVGDPGSIGPLLELQSRERDNRVRSEVADALRSLTHRSALDRMLAAAEDLTPRRRSEIHDGLWILVETGVLEDLWRRCESRKALRRRVLDLLARVGRAAGIPILLLSLESGSTNVRRDSIRLLRSLTGQNFGFDPEAGKVARHEALARWQEWWRDARPKGAGRDR